MEVKEKMSKKTKGRKLFSILLVLAMIFSTFTGIVPDTGSTVRADVSAVSYIYYTVSGSSTEKQDGSWR